MRKKKLILIFKAYNAVSPIYTFLRILAYHEFYSPSLFDE